MRVCMLGAGGSTEVLYLDIKGKGEGFSFGEHATGEPENSGSYGSRLESGRSTV